MHARLVVLTCVLAAGGAYAAEPVPIGGVPDLAGPRSLALSASIGVAAGNDGIFVNPAALAARKRLSSEAGLLVDRRGADTAGRFFGGSIVDSTQPVTGAVSYLRNDRGPYTGNLWHLAIAGPIAEQVFVGVSGKYLSLKGPDATSAATADAGIFLQASQYVSIGAAGYNLVPIGNGDVAPRGAGAGIAIGNDRVAQVTADWRADFDRADKTTNRYAAGLEVLLARLIPVRAGFVRDETLDTSWWSLGVGIVTQSAAIDFGYRQSVDDPSARTVAATLKLFATP